jgi:hypothetical protein
MVIEKDRQITFGRLMIIEVISLIVTPLLDSPRRPAMSSRLSSTYPRQPFLECGSPPYQTQHRPQLSQKMIASRT